MPLMDVLRMSIHSAFRHITCCVLFAAFSATAPAQDSLSHLPLKNATSRHAPIWLVQHQQPSPVDPVDRRNTQLPGKSYQQTLPEELFGNVNQLDRLSEHRQKMAHSPAADAVFGGEAKGRGTNDIGDLLRKSISSHGVSTQNRTPIVSDTRVRGQKAGQILASGSYWTPVRSDLDTMMNKIDSRLIDDVIVIKGPYSTRYGPGAQAFGLLTSSFFTHRVTTATKRTDPPVSTTIQTANRPTDGSRCGAVRQIGATESAMVTAQEQTTKPVAERKFHRATNHATCLWRSATTFALTRVWNLTI
jgi:hypothetical protein